MATNRIAQMKAVQTQDAQGPLTAIMIAVDVADIGSAPAFVQEVADKFKAYRMMSPPDTAGMLVTIMGTLAAGDFAKRWKAIAAKDQALALFMSQMRVADVIQGTPQGQVLSSASLLGT